jgi:hypothetical protein
VCSANAEDAKEMPLVCLKSCFCLGFLAIYAAQKLLLAFIACQAHL